MAAKHGKTVDKANKPVNGPHEGEGGEIANFVWWWDSACDKIHKVGVFDDFNEEPVARPSGSGGKFDARRGEQSRAGFSCCRGRTGRH